MHKISYDGLKQFPTELPSVLHTLGNSRIDTTRQPHRLSDKRLESTGTNSTTIEAFDLLKSSRKLYVKDIETPCDAEDPYDLKKRIYASQARIKPIAKANQEGKH